VGSDERRETCADDRIDGEAAADRPPVDRGEHRAHRLRRRLRHRGAGPAAEDGPGPDRARRGLVAGTAWLGVLAADGSPTGPGPGAARIDVTRDELFSSGTVELQLADEDGVILADWGVSTALGDVFATRRGLKGASGMVLTLQPAGVTVSLATCRRASTGEILVGWDRLSRGSVLCVQGRGQRGAVQLDSPPDLTSSNPKATVSGVLWAIGS
jgi:hypothetical protein